MTAIVGLIGFMVLGSQTAMAADSGTKASTPKTDVAKSDGRGQAQPRVRQDLALAAPSNTIFWGVDSNGVLTLSDRPAANTTKTGSQTYSSSTDSASLARARQEREYWRAQADRFRDRQLERERSLEEARRVRFLESRERDRFYSPPPVFARSPDWWAARNAPLVGGFAVPQVYSSSPGAAPPGPASFIGSGFSSSGRR